MEGFKPLTLSTAYATWVRNEDDNKWIIRDQSGKELWDFPNSFKEAGCMSAIRLGRKFELEAFNIGIALGKESRDAFYGPRLQRMKEQIHMLEQMNINLSNKLEKFIIGDDEEVK